jgi:hypothetical protein
MISYIQLPAFVQGGQLAFTAHVVSIVSICQSAHCMLSAASPEAVAGHAWGMHSPNLRQQCLYLAINTQ